jgi:hypothetical protein
MNFLSSPRERLPSRRAHQSFPVEHNGLRFTVGVGRYADGQLAEVNLNTDKVGTGFDTVLRNSAILLSIALQFGADAEVIRRAMLRNGDGSAAGPIGAVLDLLRGLQ